MNKTSLLLGLTALVVGGAALAPQAVQAYRDGAVKGPNYTEAREHAVESANLAQFKETCTTGRICQVVDTQEKLNIMQKMHTAMEKGDTVTATQLRTELGLGLQNGAGRGQGMGRNRVNR